MPTYEYACDRCQTVFKVRHGIDAPRPKRCPECAATLRKVVSAPSLNTKRFTSPTQEKYSRLSESDEVKREAELQKVYQTVWMPDEVKHDPWDENH